MKQPDTAFLAFFVLFCFDMKCGNIFKTEIFIFMLFVLIVPRISIDLKAFSNRYMNGFFVRQATFWIIKLISFDYFFPSPFPLSVVPKCLYLKIACSININSSYKFLNISYLSYFLVWLPDSRNVCRLSIIVWTGNCFRLYVSFIIFK